MSPGTRRCEKLKSWSHAGSEFTDSSERGRHIPPGNPNNAHTIVVGAPAVPTHLAHGDTLGLCEGTCLINENCADGEYCNTDDGDCEGVGSCEVIPNICPLEYVPVCGCDGATYGNACFAALVGVNVFEPGICAGSACDTFEGCLNPGIYCQVDIGVCEGSGLCAEIPTICSLEYDPVCACDGMTYSNDCWAAMSAVNVDFSGECP